MRYILYQSFQLTHYWNAMNVLIISVMGNVCLILYGRLLILLRLEETDGNHLKETLNYDVKS
jgi:hypothetical protein